MKKFLSLLLAAIMVLSLCACNGSTGEADQTDGAGQTGGLQVGFGKVSITPDYTVGLGGYSDMESRMHTGFVDYIYTTCIAVTSGEETILIYTVDNVATSLSTKIRMRTSITRSTGIPEDKIFIGATHTHSAPSLGTAYPNGERYMRDFDIAAAKAAEQALADRAPATMYQAKANHEGLNFIRHYTLTDGTLTDSSGASALPTNQLAGHPMPSDTQMVLLKFDREGDKKDILMVNWQAHPAKANEIGYNLISPNFIGSLRNKLEKDTDTLVAYFTGAAGNQVTDSLIPGENPMLTYTAYGEKLAECAYSMLDSLQPVEGTAVKSTRQTVKVAVDHSWDHMVAQADQVYEVWKSQGLTMGDNLAKTYNMSSSYHARAIRDRAKMGATVDMEISAFSIGDVGFTTGSYEMFSDNGIFVKENSPFETNFIITGCSSYVASDIAFTYRNYEADTGFYARGVAEQLADEYVKMLTSLK